MKILVAGVVIMATISIGGYAISRNVGGEKKEKIPGCFDRIQQILRVLVDLSTVISMILVFFTLQEMQIERDHAYRPNIVAENSSLYIVLNTHAGEDIGDIKDVALNLYNIGVGVAEQVSISVDENSYLNICRYLDSIADDKTNSYTINNTNFVIEYPDGRVGMTPRKIYEYKASFVLQNAQEKISYNLPRDLINIITDIEVCRHLNIENASNGVKENEQFCFDDITIPDVEFKIDLQDVQGKKYDDRLTLHFEQGVISTGKDGITHERLTIRAY